MFSLDVVQWREKHSEMPNVKKKSKSKAPDDASLPRMLQEKKLQQIYGKTSKEMHESYLDRVNQWMKEAPSRQWTTDYEKEFYSKTYMPRVRRKELEHGGPNVKIGTYSPRSVCKGGGACVQHLVDPRTPTYEDTFPREEYKERIINFQIKRDKQKELHPPMAIPKNKPLSCAKYFVSDVISCSCSNNNDDNDRNSDGTCRKCAARCPSPKKKSVNEDEAAGKNVYERLYTANSNQRGDKFDPPTTAEYVASPQWRKANPQKWVGNAFSSTVASTNAHTAARLGISGTPYASSVLTAEPYVPKYNWTANSPSCHQLNVIEHERRAETATANLQRSPQRTEKKYFNSMWSESPGASSTSATSPPRPHTRASFHSGSSGRNNFASGSELASTPSAHCGGRDLLLSLRNQAHMRKSSSKSPKKSSQHYQRHHH